ncbi:hypothetical protein ACLAEM_005112, partial [Escherichia coli]
PLKGSVVFDVRRAWRGNKKRSAKANLKDQRGIFFIDEQNSANHKVNYKTTCKYTLPTTASR